MGKFLTLDSLGRNLKKISIQNYFGTEVLLAGLEIEGLSF